jgi:hypothetical protein
MLREPHRGRGQDDGEKRRTGLVPQFSDGNLLTVTRLGAGARRHDGERAQGLEWGQQAGGVP